MNSSPISKLHALNTKVDFHCQITIQSPNAFNSLPEQLQDLQPKFHN